MALLQELLEDEVVKNLLEDFRKELIKMSLLAEANELVELFENLSDPSLLHHFLEYSKTLEKAKIGDSGIKSKYYLNKITYGTALSHLTIYDVEEELEEELSKTLLTSKSKYFEDVKTIALDLQTQEDFVKIYENLNSVGMQQLVDALLKAKESNWETIYQLYENNFTQLYEYYYTIGSVDVLSTGGEDYGILFLILHEYFNNLEIHERIDKAKEYRIHFTSFMSRYKIFGKDIEVTDDFYLELYKVGGPNLIFELFEKLNEEIPEEKSDFYDTWFTKNNLRLGGIHYFNKDKFLKLYKETMPINWNIELNYNDCLIKS